MESAVTRSAAAVARRHGNLRGHARKIAQRASLRAAKAAGLRHVSDTIPGYRRHKRGKTFTYTDGRGKQLKDARVLQRIRSLVIPPAWTQVWICPLDNGHLQVTGYDGRGRNETPVWIPEQRALVFADALTAPAGELRVWGTPWHEKRVLPALRELLDLPFEHVIVSHGEPVHDRAAFENALERTPWGY